MDHYYIGQLEALEIFCRIVVKFEKREVIDAAKTPKVKKDLTDKFLAELHSGEEITKKLKYYQEHLDDLAKALVEGNEKKKAYKSLLVDFIENIQHAAHQVISENFRSFLYRYIEISAVTNHVFIPWKPAEKIKYFIGTTWSIYYHDEHVEGKKIDEGIVRGTLKLSLFGRAHIRTLASGSNDAEEYIGRYSITNSRILQLEMKRGEKALSIVIYIGSSDIKPALAIGQFRSFADSISAGTVLIEHLKNESSHKNSGPKFFTTGKQASPTSQKRKLPHHIIEFFSERRNSYWEVPFGVTNEDTLKTIIALRDAKTSK